MDVGSFKNLMRKWPTGISIITTIDTMGNKYGFTANSFTSVSLDPMLVSFCINKQSPTLSKITESKKFAITILGSHQENLVHHFATPHLDKFSGVDYGLGSLTNCPYIKHAVGFMECSLKFQYPGGDHDILVGEVLDLHLDPAQSPLIYVERGYK